MTWVKEIDLKLKDMIGQMYVTRNGRNIPVTNEYGRAEGEDNEIIKQKLPLINRRLYDITLDLERIGINQWQLEKVGETEDTVDVKYLPVPHLLFYEFTVTTEYQEDLIDLTTQLISIFPLRGAFFMEDQEGESFPLYLEGIGWEEAERINPEKTKKAESMIRRFRNIFRYKITAELDRHEVSTYYKVKEVVIDDQLKEEG